MLTGLAWLALEVKYLEPAREFYEETLEMARSNRGRDGVRRAPSDRDPGSDRGPDRDDELAFAAGETDLILRRPTSIPRGGLHTHFALSIPAAEYDDWWDRLGQEYDLEETVFGSARSLYLYDPDGNCVELGQRDVEGPGIDGVFEIALEVESLERAEAFYAALGFETVDRGEKRRRVRMAGPMALELWEPQLGIADARGGVHVDLGFVVDDLDAAIEAVDDRACSIERESPEEDEEESGTDRAIVRDPDGHHLTFVSDAEPIEHR